MPNIFLGGVMGYIALSCAWELWQTGDPKLMWGRTTQAAAVECGTWFMVFVGMDTLLSILHGDMDKETAVHHGAARLLHRVLAPALPLPTLPGMSAACACRSHLRRGRPGGDQRLLVPLPRHRPDRTGAPPAAPPPPPRRYHRPTPTHLHPPSPAPPSIALLLARRGRSSRRRR